MSGDEPGTLDAPAITSANAASKRSRTAAALAARSYSTRRCSTSPPSRTEHVGGAVVSVERHAHAAGVDELDAALGLACEREVRVAEHETRSTTPSSSSVLVRRWPGTKLRTSETGDAWQ